MTSAWLNRDSMAKQGHLRLSRDTNSIRQNLASKLSHGHQTCPIDLFKIFAPRETGFGDLCAEWDSSPSIWSRDPIFLLFKAVFLVAVVIYIKFIKFIC